MFAVVQMILQDSKKFPLKVWKLEWFPQCGWLFENVCGSYRVIAVFADRLSAAEAKRKLSSCRYTYTKTPSGQCLCLPVGFDSLDDILTLLQIAGIPGCLYRYRKREESFTQWLKQKRPS